MLFQLAQINIARLLAPVDDPKIADLSRSWTKSTHWPRTRRDLSGDCSPTAAMPPTFRTPTIPFVIVNMSVWESVEALRDYTYTTRHVDVFRDRARWFEKAAQPHYCLWWVPEGHIPTVAEGRERLEHYQRHGATPFSFWFSQRFPAPADEPATV